MWLSNGPQTILQGQQEIWAKIHIALVVGQMALQSATWTLNGPYSPQTVHSSLQVHEAIYRARPL